MSPLVDHVLARVDRAVALLGLPPEARHVLHACAAVDLGGEHAAAFTDTHGRAGIVSWSSLLAVADTDASRETSGPSRALEAAAWAVHDWGLAQIVGVAREDPVVAGETPLRLTGLGRLCLGLGPLPPGEPAPAGPETAWEILHGASHERLVVEAGATHRSSVVAADATEPATRLCGRLALAGCATGRAVLDACHLPESAQATLLAEVLWRTARARFPRTLLLLQPAPVRAVALALGAGLRWVAPEPVARRGGLVLDRAVTARLLRDRPDAPDAAAAVTGVPDVEGGIPVRPAVAWHDVLVPAAVRRQLDQALAHARFRLRAGGPGYRLLLSGVPGGGKSMVAEALAAELGRPLVKLDLSALLSRWLGETERNLAQVFDAAESAGAVLVLDEAEALLRQRGDRTEGVSTAVAYLLTRMDRYRGVLVGTTNRTRDVDEAFFRRFDDYVVLPVPDEATRRLLWLHYLDRTGVPHEVDVDFVARRFAVSGALVRGATIRAAAWAVAGAGRVATPVLLASLARELEKSDRSGAEVLIEPYRAAVQVILDGEAPASEQAYRRIEDDRPPPGGGRKERP